MIEVEPACFGFLAPVLGDTWTGVAQRPFRGHTLLLFGAIDAVLSSLRLGLSEQLVAPLPFPALVRPWLDPPAVAGMLLDPFDAQCIVNVRCKKELLLRPLLMLETIRPGDAVTFGFAGHVSGVLLVGEQIA